MASRNQEYIDRAGKILPIARDLARKMGVSQDAIEREIATQITGEDAWHIREEMMKEGK